MNRRILYIGFTLFALFFGAGNLIFPPNLGWSSGGTFNWAIAGFIITGVGLPLIGVIAGSFSDDGYQSEARRVHPWFSVAFMVAIYLTIGPFFAIPRTASTSYEMGILPYFTEKIINVPVLGDVSVYLFFFTLVYFIIAFILSVKPNKIVDNVGKVLTPLLLISIVALIIRSFFVLGDSVETMAPSFNPETPFFNGFLEGYKTMDTIAAIAFVIIVIKAVKASGLEDRKKVFKEAFLAAIVAGICLALVYLSLGWLGNHFDMSLDKFQELEKNKHNVGTYILTQTAGLTYAAGGKMLISAIVLLACLTTSIGLIVAISSYFYELWPRHSYKTYAVIFTLISFVLANQGLSMVIKRSIPVLLVIYPIAIVLIGLVILDKVVHKSVGKGIPNLCFQLPIYLTIVISMFSVLYPDAISFLPFEDISMQWLLPALGALVIGLIINPMLGGKKEA